MLYFHFFDLKRSVKGIQGLTRETVVGIVANIESQEIQRRSYKQRGLPPEHPRASTTDYVEGFIGVLHDLLGPIFDHKTFIDQMPKICNERHKRISLQRNLSLTLTNLPLMVKSVLTKSRFQKGLILGYLWSTEHNYHNATV